MFKTMRLAVPSRTCYDAGSCTLAVEATMVEPWKDPAIVQWTQQLLDSYRQWIGCELVERTAEPEREARALFESAMVVVSHGTQADPLLNYGNQTALDLWEMSWEQLVRTPSRLTAEPLNRRERDRMLEEARARGYITTYQGIRISRTGRRFLVENALIWNVMDSCSQPIGQAATFARWTWLP